MKSRMSSAQYSLASPGAVIVVTVLLCWKWVHFIRKSPFRKPVFALKINKIVLNVCLLLCRAVVHAAVASGSSQLVKGKSLGAKVDFLLDTIFKQFKFFCPLNMFEVTS